MKSFFEENAYQELQQRLENISADTQPQWGKMNNAQMLHHCKLPLQIAVGKAEVEMKSNWLVKLFFKKMMYAPKPFKKNSPTAPQFKVTGEFDFENEKQELTKWMDELWQDRDNENRAPHPVFGHFTKEQWGVIQWKHLNHHFEQFGA